MVEEREPPNTTAPLRRCDETRPRSEHSVRRHLSPSRARERFGPVGVQGLYPARDPRRNGPAGDIPLTRGGRFV
jgi:hypothetical protein